MSNRLYEIDISNDLEPLVKEFGSYIDAVAYAFTLSTESAELRPLPQCPKCGYTKYDALIHFDHHLCDGKIPESPPWSAWTRKQFEAVDHERLEKKLP